MFNFKFIFLLVLTSILTTKLADGDACIRLLKQGEKLRDTSNLFGAEKGRFETLLKIFREKITGVGVSMKPSDLRLLVSYLFSLPDEIQRVFTKPNLQKGFKYNGSVGIDGKPDVTAMLSTVRGKFDDGELQHLLDVFPACLAEVFRIGELSDKFMLALGIAPDRNIKGEVVLRTATTGTAESRMRAKPMSMQAQRTLRTLIDLQRVAIEETKRQRLLAWYTVQIKQNSETEGGVASDPGTTVATATLESFSTCIAPQLTSFCVSRTFQTKDDMQGYKFPKKGKLAEAKAGAHNLITLAFSLRAGPIVLAAPASLTAAAVVAPPVEPAASTPPLAPPPSVVASTFINQANNTLVKRLFCGYKGVQVPIATDVDMLCSILQQRLNIFVFTKIETEKQNNWVWPMMQRLMPYLSYVATVFGHVEPDLASTTAASCLLYPDATARFVAVPAPAVAPAVAARASARSGALHATRPNTGLNYTQGAYLFVHNLHRRWLRAGKVGGRDIPARTREHLRAAALASPAHRTNNFYGRYPTKAAYSADSTITAMRAGYFDDLTCVYALGFSRDNAGDVAAFLQFTEGEKKHIAALSFNEDGYHEKTAHIIAYAIECFYSLMLAPGDDLSSNPGFEVPLGIYSTPF